MSSDGEKALQLRSARQGRAAVLTVCGSVGISEAEEFGAALAGLTEQKAPLIVLDLGEMDFISSSGLGAIVSAHLKTRQYAGHIKLVLPTKAIREMLATTQLNRVFGIYDSVEQAVASDSFEAE